MVESPTPKLENSATARHAEPSENGTFASLKIRDFRLLWLAGAATFLAVGIANTVRGWLAVQLTDSNAALGGVMGAFAIGLIMWTPLAGVAADRLDKRRLLVVIHVFFVAIVATMGIMVITDLIEFWMILVSGYANGAGFAFMGPVRISIISEQVAPGTLRNALALSQLTVSGTMVFGPALAGLLLSNDSVGIGGSYLVAAALLGIGALPVLAIAKRPPPEPSGRSPLRELADGWAYARDRDDLRMLITYTLFMVFAAFSFTGFLPRIVETTFSREASWLGIMLSFNAAGGLVAALAVARQGDELIARRWRLAAPFVAATGLIGLAVAPTIWLVLPAVLVLGMTMTGFQTLSMAGTLMRAEPEFHGRLQSLLMLSFSAGGIASLMFGALADVIGLREVFVAMAALTVVVGTLAVGADRRVIGPEPRTLG